MLRTATAALPRLLVLGLAAAIATGQAEARGRRHHRSHGHHAQTAKPHHRGGQAAKVEHGAAGDGGARTEFLRAVTAERCSDFRMVAEAGQGGSPEAQTADETRWRALFDREPETACKAAELLLYGRIPGP